MKLAPRRALLAACASLCAAGAAQADRLLAEFGDPPQSARPQVWWHWMSGNVTLAGATLDLEWMHRVGIGGVHTFTGGGFPAPRVITPPVDFMSERWREIFRETTRQARAFGMDVTIAGSPGWSETGGVWVKPEQGMKKYVWSELSLTGGRTFDGVLPRPPATTGPFLGVAPTRLGAPPAQAMHDVYRDARVVAFPTPRAELLPAAVHTSSAGPVDLAPLAAADLGAAVTVPIAAGSSSAWLQTAFPRPVTLSALQLGMRGDAIVGIEASDDGRQFRPVVGADAVTPAFRRHEFPTSPQQTYAFQAVTARVFRVVLTAPAPAAPLPGLLPILAHPQPPTRSFEVTRLTWAGGARVNRFESKAGFQSSVDPEVGPTPQAAPAAVIPAGSLIDLTDRVDAAGHLTWPVPRGHWTVLRLGWSLTGQTNGPAEPRDTGLEVDKLDAAQVRDYVEQYLAQYQAAMGAPLGAANVQSLLTDSWEAGAQNWTPGLLREFQTRRGYDPLPYLPVLAGRVVGDAAASERFLWDFRRTLEELLADNHYGTLARVLHEHGMQYYTEAQGDTPRAIGDGMTIKSRADIPTAEYWYREFAATHDQASLKADLKEAASAAHVYGRRLVAAESLTVAAGTDPWAFSPAMLKPVADEIFAAGINRILVHESHHQPLVDAKPGLELAFFGQFFNRNDTWAEQAGPWVSYLARTSYLLQQGRFVADVAYFYGEERNLTERYLEGTNDDVPAGYAYDYVNPEALSTLLSVSDGRLQTPSGMSYRVLYLPAYVSRLTLPVLTRLRDLVTEGAVLVGGRPTASLGLDAPDAAFATIVTQLWGDAQGTGAARAVGRGRVYSGDLAGALAAEGIAPDVAIHGAAADTMMTLHRHTPDADIYFLVNRAARSADVDLQLRDGGVPELWHAEDGRAQPVRFSATPAGLRVFAPIEAQGAEFLVVRHPPQAAGGAPAVLPEPRALAPQRELELARLGGPWAVTFEARRGAPAQAAFDDLIDWSTSSDPGIKYFSGAATYARTLTVPAAWLRGDRRIVLDLGEVHELAVLSIDGKPVAQSWHSPYRLDLTGMLTPGRHRLEIQVVNLWVNRLVGDKQPGAVAVAFAPQSTYQADTPLRRSGLLGPVRVLGYDAR